MNKQFFYLLRAAIGTGPFFERPRTSDEWRAMYRLSVVQGVTAVVFDFMKTLPKSEAPDRALLMEWLSTATSVEQTMQRMQVTAEEFAEAMEKREIPVVVLRGMAFAQYYPNPLFRECGDLDCCMMAAWICRVPRRVHTFTGLVWPTTTGLKRSILMLTDKILCLCATHIIPEGQGVLQDLQAHITKKPMKVLGYGNVRGVDINYWDKTESVKEEGHKLRCRYGIDHEFTFLYVGRIVKDKGINELVEAFNELYSSHPESRLILVGPKEDNLDPISEKSKEIIEHLPSIIMTGPVFGRDLVNHYSAADCFVLPSYREGFPNTPIEAGAMRLPCIVTDINGSREIIEDGNNGIIVPSKDSSALCKAMTNLIENKCLCYSMAENARPMIVSCFEQGFVRKCLFDFYNEIM